MARKKTTKGNYVKLKSHIKTIENTVSLWNVADNLPEYGCPFSIDYPQLQQGYQIRDATDDATVAEYAAAIDDGDLLPPLKCVEAPHSPTDDETRYILVDGYHRLAARQALHLRDFPDDCGYDKLRLCIQTIDNNKFDHDELFLLALEANRAHALRLTTADKQRAVRVLLRGKFAVFSDRDIAGRVGCSDKTVAKIRREMEGENATETVEQTRVGKDGKARKVPVKKPKPAPIVEPEQTEIITTADVTDDAVTDVIDAPENTKRKKEKKDNGYKQDKTQTTTGDNGQSSRARIETINRVVDAIPGTLAEIIALARGTNCGMTIYVDPYREHIIYEVMGNYNEAGKFWYEDQQTEKHVVPFSEVR